MRENKASLIMGTKRYPVRLNSTTTGHSINLRVLLTLPASWSPCSLSETSHIVSL